MKKIIGGTIIGGVMMLSQLTPAFALTNFEQGQVHVQEAVCLLHQAQGTSDATTIDMYATDAVSHYNLALDEIAMAKIGLTDPIYLMHATYIGHITTDARNSASRILQGSNLSKWGKKLAAYVFGTKVNGEFMKYANVTNGECGGEE